MAIIVSSTIVSDSPQSDGRRYVRERHVEADGTRHDVTWMAEVGQEADAFLAIRAAQIEAQLIENEIAENLAEAESE